MTRQMKMTILAGAALLVIVLLAVALRLYNIKNYPPGLYPDEAANGEDILMMFHGDVQPFYPRGNGREALFFFLQAAMIRLFGIGVWPLHLAAALVGITTVLAMYYATKVWFGRLSGLLAAFFLATNHWHLTLSRTGFRAIMVPLFVALFTAWVGFTIQSVKNNKIFASYIYAALAGAAFAGGFYTYIAYRALVGVVLVILLLLLIAAMHPLIGFPHFRRYWKQTLVAIIAAVIVISPLAWYLARHPDAILGRAGQVSVFNPNLQTEFGQGTLAGTLLYSTRTTLLSFFAGTGDLNWRHNVAGFPLLNPLVGVLFLLGIAWAINGTVTVFMEIIKGREVHIGMIYPYLLLLLGGMLAPVVTTAEGMPHALRSLGLIVPIFMLAGTAGSVSLYWLKNKVQSESVRFAGYGIAVGLLVLNLIYGPALYFMIAGNDAKAYYEYRGDLTVVSKYLNDYHKNHADAPVPYLVLDKYSLQTVTYLTMQIDDYLKGSVIEPDDAPHIWKQVDPATSYKQKLAPGEIMVFSQSTIFDAERYRKEHPSVKTIATEKNKFGQEILRVYQNEANAETPGIPSSLDAGI